MKRRGHRIVRYADDILILCRSQTAAVYAYGEATTLLKDDLRLTMNMDKTYLVHDSQGVKFLGAEIGLRWSRIQAEKIAAFKEKVKSHHTSQ